MGQPPPADHDLLRRHVAGDRTAFAELVARHRDRRWRMALRTLGERDDARQDALASANRSASRFRGDAEVMTWLHRILVNACGDVARRAAGGPTVPLDPDGSAAAATDPVTARESAPDLPAALRTLPIDQRPALVLIDVEHYPVAEASAILGAPIGTIKGSCARARASLAALVAVDDERNRSAAASVRPHGTRQPEQTGEERP